jgi:hypothetical protein
MNSLLQEAAHYPVGWVNCQLRTVSGKERFYAFWR